MELLVRFIALSSFAFSLFFHAKIAYLWNVNYQQKFWTNEQLQNHQFIPKQTYFINEIPKTY